MAPTVRIMMATYNGEKYLEEQLDSICGQTYQNWSLIIQDDGSNDSTWAVLERYADKDDRIIIKRSPEEKHGAYYNFHSIANQEKENGTKYDYYMFCDQDDIWDSDKIERMMEYLTIGRKPIPQFLFGDMRVIDREDHVIIDSIAKTQGLNYKNPESLFFCHIIYGCNVMMNQVAFFCVPPIDLKNDVVSILSHDNLYAKYSGVLGEVLFLDQQLMSYRRHGNNATAAQQYGFGINRIVKRISKIEDLANDHARTYRQSLFTISLMSEGTIEKKDALSGIESAIKTGGIPGACVFIKMKVNCGKPIKTISRLLILTLGLHKKYL